MSPGRDEGVGVGACGFRSLRAATAGFDPPPALVLWEGKGGTHAQRGDKSERNGATHPDMPRAKDRSAAGRVPESSGAGGSFWISEISAVSAPPPRPPMIIATTQTTLPTVEAAVSTDIVMDDLSFRCVACSKPPAAPRFYNKDRHRGLSQGSESRSSVSLAADLREREALGVSDAWPLMGRIERSVSPWVSSCCGSGVARVEARGGERRHLGRDPRHDSPGSFRSALMRMLGVSPELVAGPQWRRC